MSGSVVLNCIYDSLVSCSNLKPNPRNTNKHPDKQIDLLIKIIAYQGWRHPIIVSKLSGFIVAGHGRWMAAKKAGWENVPVVYQNFDNKEQEYAFLESDNHLAELSEHSLDEMIENLKDFPDLNLEMLGIPDFKLEDDVEIIPECDEDEIPEIKEDPISKPGDIYKLGDHRLMCGDSTLIDHVEKLMNGQKADMVFTDPPYNTGMTSEKQKGSGGLCKGKGGGTKLSHMFNDAYTDDQWNEFLRLFTTNYWLIMKENSVAYICLDWRRNHELIPHLVSAGFKRSNLIIWDKVVHGLGSDYKYTHEFINVCKKGKPKLDTHQGDREYSDVWHIQRKMGKDEEHATKKPIEIVERPIRHSTIQNQLIVDLFGGSGTTLIACEKTKRKCFMMELDPRYCDVIVSRWEKYTGKKAELIVQNPTETGGENV